MSRGEKSAARGRAKNKIKLGQDVLERLEEPVNSTQILVPMALMNSMPMIKIK